jgi:PleD family two-component response regulator
MKRMSTGGLVKGKSHPKVLVIDVDAGHIEEIMRPLQENGFRVVSCSSPRGALGRIRAELPDAVVVEVIMPGVSGFEIAARMQADRRLSNIPILFTTDIQDSEGENHDYFARPLDVRGLIRALRKRIAAGA